MNIAYQGIEGSNSEEAAKKLAKKFNLQDVEFLPLISSDKVIEALKLGHAQYGVVATHNAIGGIVTETQEALKGIDAECLEKHSMHIHHCLFVKNKEINLDDVTTVVSHPQALAQTKQNLTTLYPQMQAEPIEDTALGAKRLAKGELSENTAVICSKRAGESFGLYLLKENIEDSLENITDFQLIKLK